MFKNYKRKCCDPLKWHKKTNFNKNNFISNCLYNHCSQKKLETHEELQDQKDHSSDNLYCNQNPMLLNNISD
ncbi:hypothetical protein Anas_14576 [Armadillidium nasatum]|uniref:Uncharacterized protein n=1 Tax=Armadillidium nasatum TaxID=96803 RepID=A0A5N5T9D2_9CRUS|nr:hypothetical protein Anas_14576 [Armadillidium nasatum]